MFGKDTTPATAITMDKIVKGTVTSNAAGFNYDSFEGESESVFYQMRIAAYVRRI